MNDTYRCRDCEVLIFSEDNLCEDCHADWIGWLEKRDKERANVGTEMETA